MRIERMPRRITISIPWEAYILVEPRNVQRKPC